MDDGFAELIEEHDDVVDEGNKGEEDEKGREERKRQKRLEQLDKKIKRLQKKNAKDKPILKVASEIKNKHKRQEVVIRKKLAQNQARLIGRLKKKKLREEEGDEVAPKGVTKTIESMRVADDTLITNADDEEIKGEQSIDEFSDYFKNLTTPKILMTTNRRPKGGIFHFLKEVKTAIPNTYYYQRDNNRIKDIIEWAKKREFTDIMVFYEKHGNPRNHSLQFYRYTNSQSLTQWSHGHFQSIRSEAQI